MKENRNFNSNNPMSKTKTFVKKEQNFMRTEKDLNSSNNNSKKHNKSFILGGKNTMKKWEKGRDLKIADVIATELSVEERDSILDTQSQIVVDTHEKVLIDLSMERGKKDCKVNRKIQAEVDAEAKYKNCKAPIATAKDGMLIFDDAIVEDTLPGAKFKVNVAGNVVVCYLNGKLRQNKIKITKGDSVRVEMSTYGLNEGRITWRF